VVFEPIAVALDVDDPGGQCREIRHHETRVRPEGVVLGLDDDPLVSEVRGVRVELGGKTCLLRTDLRGSAFEAFQAAGVRPPSPVTQAA